MSLTVDGVWKAGVWATTVWGEGVWREGEFVPTTPPGGGGGSASRRRILRRRKVEELRPTVEDRISDTAEIAQEIARSYDADAAGLPSERIDELLARQQSISIQQLSEEQIAFEIGALVRKKIRTREEEFLLILLLAASASIY